MNKVVTDRQSCEFEIRYLSILKAGFRPSLICRPAESKAVPEIRDLIYIF